MEKVIRLGMIGLGGRGRSLMKQTQVLGRNVKVTAVCDERIHCAEMSADIIEEMKANATYRCHFSLPSESLVS